MIDAPDAPRRAVPLIVTALMGDADFAYFDGLRRHHYPSDRNVLRAHLTLFHHLPMSIEHELSIRTLSSINTSLFYISPVLNR